MDLFGLHDYPDSASPARRVPVRERGGWFPLVRESYAGAWQQNVAGRRWPTSSPTSTVFACVSLIASDISKMRLRLVAQVLPNIWEETESRGLLARPPQTEPLSDADQVRRAVDPLEAHAREHLRAEAAGPARLVVALYVLDPQRVAVLVAPDGSVWYELKRDDLSGLAEDDSSCRRARSSTT